MINEKKMDEIMLDMGFPEHLAGTRFLRLAVPMYRYDTDITREIYPAIAAATGSTASRVERSIRHAIESAWTRNTYDVERKYFGNSIHPEKGRPTNGEMIATIARLAR